MLISAINRKSVERTLPFLSILSFVDLFLFVLHFFACFLFSIHYGLVFCYNVICDEINNRLIIYSVKKKNLKDHHVSRRRKNQDNDSIINNQTKKKALDQFWAFAKKVIYYLGRQTNYALWLNMQFFFFIYKQKNK